MLESLMHEHSWFVTLTYSDEHYPEDGSLRPRDLQLFMKRLREEVEPRKVRFFAVGEYGDTKLRAHYHLALFGLDDPSVVERAWRLGFVVIGPLTMQSAAYVCGYVTKKLTKRGDARLDGKYPEFARMSLRPGIGAGAVDEIGRYCTTLQGSRVLTAKGDVPGQVRWDSKKWPLGRYLMGKVRESAGMLKQLPDAARFAHALELIAELEAPGGRQARENRREAARVSAEARAKIQSSKRSF